MELQPLTKALIGVLGVGAVALAIWLGRTGGVVPVDRANDDSGSLEIENARTRPSNPLSISPSGPYPKVVVDEPDHKFERMALGTTGQHVFQVRNEGEAPLMLKPNKTTCDCTISKVEDGQIPPGGTAEVKLEWKAVNPTENFRQLAKIWTNDPNREVLELSITGAISEPVETMPLGTWVLNRSIEDEAVTVTGFVFSRVLENFELKGPIESSSPALAAEAKPMSPEELQSHEANCGYVVQLTLKPEMPVGRFREQLTVRVDRPEVAPIDIFVDGTRTGPISFLPTPGTHWDSRLMAVDLRQFDADRGAKGALLMFVGGLKEEEQLELLSTDAQPNVVNVTLERDAAPQAGDRKKYRLTFEVPPGSPPLTRGIDNPVRITIKTNHPKAGELKFRVQFIST